MPEPKNCPKCRAEYASTKEGFLGSPVVTFACGTKRAELDAPLQSDRCRLNVAERGLAAAKVLAEAVENWEEVCLPPKIAAALAAFNETMKE